MSTEYNNDNNMVFQQFKILYMMVIKMHFMENSSDTFYPAIVLYFIVSIYNDTKPYKIVNSCKHG